MDNLHTVMVLLTIAVILLSVVIIALLATVTIVLLKLKKLMNSAHTTVNNLSAATKWLNPATVFSELVSALRRK